MSDSAELIRLRQEIRESRQGISREYAGLLSDLDFQKRFTESVKRHPWDGSAGLLRRAFSPRFSADAERLRHPLPNNPPKLPATEASGIKALSKAGWVAGALEVGKLLYPVLRPVVIQFVSNAAKSGLAKRSRLQ